MAEIEKRQDRLQNLNEKIHEGYTKYVYFILAANGSAIGFTIQLIISRNITTHLLWLILSILSCGVSFYSGCRFVLGLINYNCFELFGIVSNDKEEKIVFEEKLKKEIKYVRKYSKLMFHSLIMGMLLFVIWFILLQINNIKL